jgi:hypothetical protein
MFAIIYRSYVLPGYESQYKDNWYTIANYFVKYRGAIGSCLHQAEDGMYLAYSRWPDKKTRDASWPQSGENPACKLLKTFFSTKQTNLKQPSFKNLYL